MKCLLAFQFTIFNLCIIYAISFTEFWPSQHWPFHFHSNICKKDFCMICISSQMTSKHRAQVELWYRLRLKLEFFSYLLSLSHWRFLNLFTCKNSDFFKWALPGLFPVYFCLLKQTLQFLQQITVKMPSSILSWDSNPLPLEHKSPPITTRRGLPTQKVRLS